MVTRLPRTASSFSPRSLHQWQSATPRSEEHTSELQSQSNLVCRLLLEKKKTPPPAASPLAPARPLAAPAPARAPAPAFSPFEAPLEDRTDPDLPAVARATPAPAPTPLP